MKKALFLVVFSVALLLGCAQTQDEKIEELVGELKLRHDAAGKEAVKALTEIGKPAVPRLLEALKDEDWAIRVGAVEVLSEIGGEEVVEPINERLKDTQVEVRRCAATALGKIADKDAIEALIDALRDADSHVRANAAQALGEIGGPWALEPLFKLLKADETNVRAGAAGALKKITKQDFGENYQKWMGWHDRARKLRRIANLIEKLKEEDQDVRYDAAKELAKMGELAAEPMIKALRSTYKVVRENAAWVLGEIGDKRAVEPLIEALSKKEKGVRGYVILALGKLGDERAIEPLIETLDDPDRNIYTFAAKALKQITGQDLGDSYDKWKRWYKENKDK